jgi:hypothetical protein
VRGHAGAAEHVVVLATRDAPRRTLLGAGLRRRRRPRPVAPGAGPAPVSTTVATVIDAAPFPTADDAERWLDSADAEAHLAGGLAVLERVVHLQRLAAADATLPPPSRALALAARVGIGAGEQVAEGRWRRALELPPAAARPRREAALRPQERLGALLGGRDAALACETLALRARADADAGRWREAAFQLDAALAAAVAELEPWRDRSDVGARIDELRALREEASAAVEAARAGGLDSVQIDAVSRALGRLEAALRARTALGFD